MKRNFIYRFRKTIAIGPIVLLLLCACQPKKKIAEDFSQATQGLHIDSLVGIIKTNIGKGLNGEDQYFDIAIKLCDSVLQQNNTYLRQDSTRLAELYHRFGVAYRANNIDHKRFLIADSCFAKATALREQLLPKTEIDLANTYLQWGVLKNKKQQWREAIQLLEKSELVFNFNNINPKNQIWTIDVALRLGHSLNQVGEYQGARERMKSVINYLHKNPIDETRLGLAYRYYAESQTSNLDSAAYFFKKSINIFDKNLNIDEIVRSYICYGYILIQKKEYQQAIDIFKKVAFICKKNKNIQIIKVYNHLILNYIDIKDYDNAIYYGKNKALVVLDSLPNSSEVQYERYAVIANLGDAFFGKKDYKNALQYYHNALKIITLSKKEDVMSSPSVEDLQQTYYKNTTTIALLCKARTLRDMATKYPKEFVPYAKAAIAHYKSLAILKAMIRQDLWSEESKISISQSQDWLPEALNLAYQLWQKTDEKTYQEQAFYLAQQAKTQLLLEHYQGEQGKIMSNVPEKLLLQERLFEANIANLRKQKIENPNDNSLIASLLAAESRLREFTTQLEKDYPQYYQIKYDFNPITVKEIQARLPNDMALLEYMPCDKELHSFVVTTKGLDWYKTATSDKDSIAAFRLGTLLANADSTSATHENFFLQQSHQLYQALIAPLQPSLQAVKRLKIVPAGWLYHVNFETLLEKPYKNGHWSDKKIPYLIRNYAVSYQFSSKELLFQQNNKKGKVSVGSFGVSYEDEKTRNSLRGVTCDYFEHTRGGGKLLYAIHEAKQVEAMWGSGDCYLNKQASKTNFINSCREYDILHLALHGVIDCQQPDMTELVFGKDQQNEDNIMRLYEIAGLNMRCDLAVLSACHSGSGRLDRTEGVISLGRAFAMAGCHSLVTSNSYVIDDTSPQIFEVFYSSLKAQKAKDIALQEALLNYLDDHEGYLRLPYRWANFHLWGSSEVIQGTSKDDTWYYVGAAFSLLLLLGLAWKKMGKIMVN